ncbi:unnamed protein product, partial [Mesorhabditis belari]|uniref:CUB domain-containing protein n=1 Tax=Mesorhabditis belari TaxID=2138241 RepID=A0AAF3J8V6_9BILA
MRIVRGLLLTIACLIVVATCRPSEEMVKSQDGRPNVTKENTTVSFKVFDRQIDADRSCNETFEIGPNSPGFLLYPGWIGYGQTQTCIVSKIEDCLEYDEAIVDLCFTDYSNSRKIKAWLNDELKDPKTCEQNSKITQRSDEAYTAICCRYVVPIGQNNQWTIRQEFDNQGSATNLYYAASIRLRNFFPPDDDPPSVVLTSELSQRGDVRTTIDSRDTDFWVLYVTDTLNNKGGNLMATGYHWFSLPRNAQDRCEYEFYSGSIPVPKERSTDSKLFLLKTKAHEEFDEQMFISTTYAIRVPPKCTPIMRLGSYQGYDSDERVRQECHGTFFMNGPGVTHGKTSNWDYSYHCGLNDVDVALEVVFVETGNLEIELFDINDQLVEKGRLTYDSSFSSYPSFVNVGNVRKIKFSWANASNLQATNGFLLRFSLETITTTTPLTPTKIAATATTDLMEVPLVESIDL